MLNSMPPDAGTADSDGSATPWGEHRDPAGFSLRAPAGWQVHVAGPGEIAIADPQGSAAALVRVRRLPARADLAPWLAREYPATEPGLHNVQMLRAEGRGPRVANAAFDYGSNVFQGRASVVAAREGDVATIFVAAAARDQFARTLPTLTRILESFRFEDTPDGALAGRLRFATWADPYDGALLAAMPNGWRAQGGVLRSAWNTRLAVSASSPDDTVQVFFGDATLPRRFVVPGALAAADAAGGVYPGPDSDLVLAWQRADQLGAELVRARFAGQVRGVAPRRDLLPVAQRSPLLADSTATATASAADIAFTTPDGRIGMMTLMTFGVGVDQEGGSWWADGVHGYVAPADRRRAAANALLMLVASLRENPQREVRPDAAAAKVEASYQDSLRWLKDLQHAVTTARLLADDAREDASRGAVPEWRPLSGTTLERLLAIGNIAANVSSL